MFFPDTFACVTHFW